MMRFFLRLLWLVFPLSVSAAQPWILPFPEISHDSTYIFFSGTKWTAYYVPESGQLATVPRDSLATKGLLPLPVHITNSALLNGSYFTCNGNTLEERTPKGVDTVWQLPQPTTSAVMCLSPKKALEVDPLLLTETMSPAAAGNHRLWFGLALADTSTKHFVGGLGWWDPSEKRFGRIYSPDFYGFKPEWIGSVSDSVFILFTKTVKGRRDSTKLISFNIQTNTMSMVYWQHERVPGNIILSAEIWQNKLLLTTNKAVAIWRMGYQPHVWISKSWAAPSACWLYLKTFPDGDPDKTDPVKFLPLKSNTPCEVRAQVGDWLEVISPIGIQGYADPDAWQTHGVLWSQWSWNCGDSLCFGRLRVPIFEEMRDADFLNAQITYISRDENGVKVGFQVAWARESDLAPVMMAP
jgi:hypothetical protein